MQHNKSHEENLIAIYNGNGDSNSTISDKKSAILLSLIYMQELHNLNSLDYKYVRNNINIVLQEDLLNNLDKIDIVIRFYRYLDHENKSLEYMNFTNLPSVNFFSNITNIVEYINYKYQEQLCTTENNQQYIYDDLKNDVTLYFKNELQNIDVCMKFFKTDISLDYCIDYLNKLFPDHLENSNLQYENDKKNIIFVHLTKYLLNHESIMEYVLGRYENEGDEFNVSLEYVYCRDVIKGIFDDVLESNIDRLGMILDLIDDYELLTTVCHKYNPIREDVIKYLSILIENKEFGLIEKLYSLPLADDETLDDCFHLSEDNVDLLIEAANQEYCVGSNQLHNSSNEWCQCADMC